MDSNLLIGLVVIAVVVFFLKLRKDKSSASTPAKAPAKAKKAPAKAKKSPKLQVLK